MRQLDRWLNDGLWAESLSSNGSAQRALPISMNVIGYQTRFINGVNRIFCMSIQRFIMVTIYSILH